MSNEDKEPIVSKLELYDEIGVPFSGIENFHSSNQERGIKRTKGMDRLRSSYIEQQKKLKKKNNP
jgi:hypothetical protein